MMLRFATWLIGVAVIVQSSLGVARPDPINETPILPNHLIIKAELDDAGHEHAADIIPIYAEDKVTDSESAHRALETAREAPRYHVTQEQALKGAVEYWLSRFKATTPQASPARLQSLEQRARNAYRAGRLGWRLAVKADGVVIHGAGPKDRFGSGVEEYWPGLSSSTSFTPKAPVYFLAVNGFVNPFTPTGYHFHTDDAIYYFYYARF